MELKPGYKQTEVGVIPEDWEVTNLSSLADVRDGTHDSPKQRKSGVPFVTSKNILKGRIDFEDIGYISPEDAREVDRRSKVDKGDILLSMIGTVGNAALVDFEPEFSIKNVALIKLGGLHAKSRYLIQLFRSDWFMEHLDDRLDGGIQKFVSLGMLRALDLPLPPTLAEQEAIAAALSDADALIDSLEQLIAKKRLLKQGAMQNLLTGNQRLPGFEGEWVTVTLAEIGEVSGSGVDKKIRENEEPVRLLNYMDVYRRDYIYANDLRHTVTAPSHKARRCGIEKGDVFFTPSSEVRDDIGHSAVAMEDMPGCCYSYHVVRLRLRRPWDLKFRTYAFKTKAFMDQASVLCDGSGTRYVISQSKFRSMEVKVPSDVKEQTAIAAILSDMDAEIAALEAKLAKARQVKQGMMQELLTGKTRLV